jgi:hypothetical protein
MLCQHRDQLRDCSTTFMGVGVSPIPVLNAEDDPKGYSDTFTYNWAVGRIGDIAEMLQCWLTLHQGIWSRPTGLLNVKDKCFFTLVHFLPATRKQVAVLLAILHGLSSTAPTMVESQQHLLPLDVPTVGK